MRHTQSLGSSPTQRAKPTTTAHCAAVAPSLTLVIGVVQAKAPVIPAKAGIQRARQRSAHGGGDPRRDRAGGQVPSPLRGEGEDEGETPGKAPRPGITRFSVLQRSAQQTTSPRQLPVANVPISEYDDSNAAARPRFRPPGVRNPLTHATKVPTSVARPTPTRSDPGRSQGTPPEPVPVPATQSRRWRHRPPLFPAKAIRSLLP